MRKMRPLLPLVIVSMIILSCSRYQYAVITSETGVDSVGLITSENQSLRISYAFSGLRGQAHVQIYNKLEVPLYVSWDKSAIIFSDQVASDIRKNTVTINKGPSDRKRNVDNAKIRWHRKLSSHPDSIEHTWLQAVTAIPPKSEVKSDFIYLGNKFFKQPSSDMKERLQDEAVVRYRNYSRSESPFQFRSYFTISHSADLSDSTVIASEFWVSEISVTAVKPSAMRSYLDKANVYYIAKPTAATEVISGALILGSVGFLTADQVSSE